jgi:hypothetical protein
MRGSSGGVNARHDSKMVFFFEKALKDSGQDS